LSQAVGDDVITVELRDNGVITIVTASGYRQDPFLFRDALYLGLYGLWRDEAAGPDWFGDRHGV
jgi:hypothetical protein